MKSPSSFALLLSALCLSLAFLKVNGFHSPAPSKNLGISLGRSPASVLVAAMKDPSNSDDFPREEQDDEYAGSVDWDAEWKKVMEKEKKGERIERPGKDFYKSDAELAAIRAANKAQTEMQNLSSKLPSAPSMNIRSLSGDWRFWIGVLALISIGSAVLSAQPSYTPVSNGDSFYI